MEESLNDTANLLASRVERDIARASGPLKKKDAMALREIFQNAMGKKLKARIYRTLKTRVDLRVYMTDHRGIVIFDSRDGQWEGRDFSRWNDVYRTLRGRYGARSSRLEPNNPRSNNFFVAAPVTRRGKIAGVLTVVKPKISISPFLEEVRGLVIAGALTALIVVLILGLLFTLWITRPLARLTKYVAALGRREKVAPPSLGSDEIGELGKAFEKMRSELEGKKYVSAYVQSLTHELKSPLTSVRAAAELLEEGVEPEEAERFYARIQRGATRLEEIVERLRLLSSLENRAELGELDHLPPMELLREAREDAAPDAKTLERILVENESSRMEEAFYCEKFLIRQSLVNLIRNALDFSPPNGKVYLGARRDGEYIEFTVRDEGSGIPAYARDRVFERFYSLARPGGGDRSSGLGLPFAREAAELHGGDVSLENPPAGGCLARLRLPRMPDAGK